MRSNIKQLCVITCGAVLEFKGWHHTQLHGCRHYHVVAHVANAHTIDNGRFISVHEIKLLIHKKHDRSQLSTSA